MKTSTSPATSRSSDQDRWIRAIDLMVQNLLTADSQIRNEAKGTDCLPELLAIRTILMDDMEAMRKELING